MPKLVDRQRIKRLNSERIVSIEDFRKQPTKSLRGISSIIHRYDTYHIYVGDSFGLEIISRGYNDWCILEVVKIN